MSTERRLFGELALSDENAKRIFDFCPEFYSAIYDDTGAIVAYSSAFPLKAEHASDLISGVMTEPDLEPDMLISAEGSMENQKSISARSLSRTALIRLRGRSCFPAFFRGA
jgi:hypothetical protein